MTTLHIDPRKFRQFGDPSGAAFCLLTNERLLPLVDVVEDGSYAEYHTLCLDNRTDVPALIRDQIPERAHVLVMSPDRFFQSPPPSVLGPGRKILGMACNSTPTSIEGLQHFLACMEATDPEEQEVFSDRFFELAERGQSLEYHDQPTGAMARLRLFERELVWNQQAGRVDYGEQQIVPSGEISVLPIDITEFDESLSLPLDGEIVFRGYPILHNGTPSFSRNDQRRLHERLWPMKDHGVAAEVENGVIVSIRPLAPEAQDVVDCFSAMFAVDSRYRTVWEIGHAMNTGHEILSGNHAMNEVYGGSAGCLHWGLGLTPFTQYHLDIISPDTLVTNDRGDVLLGTQGQSAPERVREPSDIPVHAHS
jgi:hypothetical protein